MDSVDGPVRDACWPPVDLRIGQPERELAREALKVHLDVDRLDHDEFEQRIAACERAHSQSELRQVFADLPGPHPQLPGQGGDRAEPDEDIPPLAVAGCLALLLGLPVAVVLGFAYRAWWALAAPVVLTVAMAYAEHLRTRSRPSNG